MAIDGKKSFRPVWLQKCKKKKTWQKNWRAEKFSKQKTSKQNGKKLEG